MNLRQGLSAVVLCLLGLLPLGAQNGDAILLRNPSFEDMPRHSTAPVGWVDCGFPGETPPDIQPDPMNQFLVRKAPQHGSTYLGMVVRDNDTWEKVAQPLSRPLQADQCYEFKIFLARSEVYMSQSRISNSNEPVNYVTPIRLRIYGGFDNCDKGQLLAESRAVTNYRWLEYRFKLEPNAAYTHIVLEAFYNTPTLFPYNGNILLDNASPLVPISCDAQVIDEDVVEAPPTPVKPTPAPPAVPPRPKPAPPTRPADTATSRQADATPMLRPDTKLNTVKRNELRVGQIFQVENINFKANSAEIDPNSEDILNEILQFMRNNEDVVVEIGGHTSGLASDNYARELSEDRAKSVVSYLVQRGVNFKRLTPKGYGKSRQIARNDTAEGRRKNQRVEVKVIGFLAG